MNAIVENCELEARLRRCLPQTKQLISNETRLVELSLDSMDTVEFLCTVHVEFGVRLGEADFQPDQTLGGLIQAIAHKVQ